MEINKLSLRMYGPQIRQDLQDRKGAGVYYQSDLEFKSHGLENCSQAAIRFLPSPPLSKGMHEDRTSRLQSQSLPWSSTRDSLLLFCQRMVTFHSLSDPARPAHDSDGPKSHEMAGMKVENCTWRAVVLVVGSCSQRVVVQPRHPARPPCREGRLPLGLAAPWSPGNHHLLLLLLPFFHLLFHAIVAAALNCRVSSVSDSVLEQGRGVMPPPPLHVYAHCLLRSADGLHTGHQFNERTCNL